MSIPCEDCAVRSVVAATRGNQPPREIRVRLLVTYRDRVADPQGALAAFVGEELGGGDAVGAREARAIRSALMDERRLRPAVVVPVAVVDAETAGAGAQLAGSRALVEAVRGA